MSKLDPFKAAYRQYRQYAENPAILYADYILALGSKKEALRLMALLDMARDFDLTLHPDNYRAAAAGYSEEAQDTLNRFLIIFCAYAPLDDTPENRAARDTSLAEFDTAPDPLWVNAFNEGFNWLLSWQELGALFEVIGTPNTPQGNEELIQGLKEATEKLIKEMP